MLISRSYRPSICAISRFAGSVHAILATSDAGADPSPPSTVSSRRAIWPKMPVPSPMSVQRISVTVPPANAAAATSLRSVAEISAGVAGTSIVDSLRRARLHATKASPSPTRWDGHRTTRSARMTARFHQHRVRLVRAVHELGRIGGITTELHVASDQPRPPDLVGDVEIRNRVECLGERGPRRSVEEEVVALDDDHDVARDDADAIRDRSIDRAIERRARDRLARVADRADEREEPQGVERLRVPP